MKIQFLCLLVAGLSLQISLKAQTLSSPDKKLTLTVTAGAALRYDVAYKGTPLMIGNTASLTLSNGKTLGVGGKLLTNKTRVVQQTVTPLYGMAAQYPNHYNELTLRFKEGYSVEFRAYNTGVAYRFVTALPGRIRIKNEEVVFNFPPSPKAWMLTGQKGSIHYETNYHYTGLSLKEGTTASLPLVVDGKAKVALLEANVQDYPVMTMQGEEANSLHGYFPLVVTQDSINKSGNGFNRVPYEWADYIAETSGSRSFPWRVMVVAEEDKDLLYNPLAYLLAPEQAITDASWIKPGLVAWDWWNANNLTGVPFKTGYNTETYKYFIDFAARNNLPYIIMDEGWSDQQDLLKLNDGSIKTNDGLNLPANLNMLELFDYAKQKGVGIILWCIWHTLDRQMTEALDQFEKWGVAGVKVDFMDREDQAVVNFYERLAREAAKRKMLVDFHGAFAPKGLERKYPNIINYEAVQGLEFNKFSDYATAENAAHIPFARMLAGPMDYTPGGLYNANQRDFRISMQRPMTQGTRCQQLALFTMLYAPLQMLADAPTAYEKEPQMLAYIRDVPTVWDATVPLDGKVGDYAALARRKGNTWYVSGINDYTPRKLTIAFDFLDEGALYNAELFTDGPNADRMGEDYLYTKRTVKRGDTITVEMAPGGGFAWKLVKQ